MDYFKGEPFAIKRGGQPAREETGMGEGRGEARSNRI